MFKKASPINFFLTEINSKMKLFCEQKVYKQMGKYVNTIIN